MEIYDANGFTAGSVEQILLAWYETNRETDDAHDNFYCGIAENPEERIADHEREDHNGQQIEKSVAYKCDNMGIAADVESHMHDIYNFDYGDPPHDANGATEESVFVYLYRKP